MSGLICITIHKLWYAAGVLNVSYLICNSQKISTQIMRWTRTYHLKPQRDMGKKQTDIWFSLRPKGKVSSSLHSSRWCLYLLLRTHPAKTALHPPTRTHPSKKKKGGGGHVFQRKWKNNGKASRTKKKKRYTYKTVLEHIKAQFRTKIKILNII